MFQGWVPFIDGGGGVSRYRIGPFRSELRSIGIGISNVSQDFFQINLGQNALMDMILGRYFFQPIRRSYMKDHSSTVEWRGAFQNLIRLLVELLMSAIAEVGFLFIGLGLDKVVSIFVDGATRPLQFMVGIVSLFILTVGTGCVLLYAFVTSVNYGRQIIGLLKRNPRENGGEREQDSTGNESLK